MLLSAVGGAPPWNKISVRAHRYVAFGDLRLSAPRPLRTVGGLTSEKAEFGCEIGSEKSAFPR